MSSIGKIILSNTVDEENNHVWVILWYGEVRSVWNDPEKANIELNRIKLGPRIVGKENILEENIVCVPLNKKN